MTNALQELRSELNKSLDALQTLEDEIRVKAHLAKMDAKDKWNVLEPQIDDLRAKARELAKSLEHLGGKIV